MKNNFFDFLESRGFIHQSTDKESIKKLFKDDVCTGYIGFDCTSDSLHVGSLLPLMILRNFQKFGHKPIILLGGGTTLIGDPSGKDETRKILTKEEIDNNKKKLRIIFEKFVSFDKNQFNCAEIVDNYDWLMQLKLIPFLREVGSKFSVNKMINLESSKIRLEREQHLSFLEFNYSVLQAYDFVELFKKFRCKIQFGGSDQWGNIISGIELAKKMIDTTLFGLTTPLITTSAGQKMGKTANGAIWLSRDKLKVTDFWQFWRNTSDSDVFQFLNYFTDLNSKDINELKNSNKDINELEQQSGYMLERNKPENYESNMFSKLQFDDSKPDGSPRKLIDSSRLVSTGWESSISLREGLASTYKEFQSREFKMREL